MLFSKDIKNLRIYRQKMFLPTLENSDTPNKKTKSAIFLLTPNRKSSIDLMKHPLLVNMRRFQSYYIERDLTYFIQSSKLNSDGDLEESYTTDTLTDDFSPRAFAFIPVESFADETVRLLPTLTSIFAP